MTMRVSRETRKKIITARAKIEYATGKKTTLEEAVQQACDYFVESWAGDKK